MFGGQEIGPVISKKLIATFPLRPNCIPFGRKLERFFFCRTGEKEKKKQHERKWRKKAGKFLTCCLFSSISNVFGLSCPDPRFYWRCVQLSYGRNAIPSYFFPTPSFLVISLGVIGGQFRKIRYQRESAESLENIVRKIWRREGRVLVILTGSRFCFILWSHFGQYLLGLLLFTGKKNHPLFAPGSPYSKLGVDHEWARYFGRTIHQSAKINPLWGTTFVVEIYII